MKGKTETTAKKTTLATKEDEKEIVNNFNFEEVDLTPPPPPASTPKTPQEMIESVDLNTASTDEFGDVQYQEGEVVLENITMSDQAKKVYHSIINLQKQNRPITAAIKDKIQELNAIGYNNKEAYKLVQRKLRPLYRSLASPMSARRKLQKMFIKEMFADYPSLMDTPDFVVRKGYKVVIRVVPIMVTPRGKRTKNHTLMMRVRFRRPVTTEPTSA